MGDSPASVLVDPADGASLKIVTDGSDRKLDITTKVRKSDGTIVNPATEDTLALIKTTDGIKKIVDPLPAGDNNIGNVDVASALPTGDNNIGNVDIASALPAGDNNIGNVDIASALPAGNNNIGDVDIASALPAGDNNIGNVDLASPIPAGTNEVGKVAQGTKAADNAGWPFYIVDSNGNKVGVVLDGAIYRLQTQAKIVRASDGAQVNPATEETLALIKTTDGIKKIVDPLAAGTNEIGKVAQGTRAAADAGWPLYIVDYLGNKVGVILDGSVYRLATNSKVGIGDSDLVHLDAIDTASGRGRLKATIYTPDGDPIAFGSVPPSPEEIYNKFCLNAGSESLLVNGATTPVVFTYPSHADHDISLQEIKFVLSANGITFGTNYFGGIAGPLTNGLLVEITAGDGFTGTVYNLKQNESFVNFASPGGFEWVVSSKDLMASTYNIGGGFKLKAGTGDNVKVTVRDNLTSAGTYFKCFVKGHLVT